MILTSPVVPPTTLGTTEEYRTVVYVWGVPLPSLSICPLFVSDYKL